MSDLRFARELGAEFERIERAGAIVVVAIALVGILRKHGGHHSVTGVEPAADPRRFRTSIRDRLATPVEARHGATRAVAHGRLVLGGVQYGLCRQQSVPVPFGLVNAGNSEHGESQGRNPNAPLATATAPLPLIAPPGSGSRASGRV